MKLMQALRGATYKGHAVGPMEAAQAGSEQAKVPMARTDEVSRLASGAFNENTSQRHYINEVRYTFYNHHVLMEALNSGRAIDLVSLPKRKDKTALIIGSGPSLDAALPLLKDWKGEIVCSTSQAPTLVRWGIEPDHILALDPDSNVGEMAVPGGWEKRKSILHLHPGVDPELVKWWPGKFSLFRKLQPQTSFYANEQNIGYGTLGPKEGHRYDGNKGEPLIKSQIPMLACVLAAQICVGKHLGYHQMFLVGCDFGFKGEKPRFTASQWTEGGWVDYSAPPPDMSPGPADPLIMTELDGLKSTPMKVFYSHQVVIAWRITETNIVNTSPGLLRMFPHAPIEEVLRRQNKGVKAFSLNKIREVAEEHLARQNIYFLWIGKGVMPHEFKDPLHEIPKMIEQLKATFKAKGKEQEFDAEANTRRIERLFKKVMKR